MQCGHVPRNRVQLTSKSITQHVQVWPPPAPQQILCVGSPSRDSKPLPIITSGRCRSAAQPRTGASASCQRRMSTFQPCVKIMHMHMQPMHKQCTPKRASAPPLDRPRSQQRFKMKLFSKQRWLCAVTNTSCLPTRHQLADAAGRQNGSLAALRHDQNDFNQQTN